MTAPAASQLRVQLEKAVADAGCSMKDLTVLEKNCDPFRIDTPARHRDGEWLAITARDLGLGDRRIHLRGLHYMVIGRPKPDGTKYANSKKDWLWLVEDAGKAARWLGYIPFDQITDQRNAPPAVREHRRKVPWPYVSVGIDVEIPDADDIEPCVGVLDFEGTQPYKLVLVAEKASAESVLGPVADRYQADLYLPSGRISDTLVYRMAATAAEDGRPMAVLYFSDCDPAGWNMPIELARKLQAFKALGTLAVPPFEVHRVALTPAQVQEYELPSDPLKDTDGSARRWREAMGIEQTELDALASLRPQLLDDLAREAIRPFYDATLGRRVRAGKQAWIDAAQAVLDDAIDQAHLDRLRAEAEARLSELRDEIAAINDALRLDVHDFDLPVPVVPEPEPYSGESRPPLINSRWSFAEQCGRLIDSKAYRNGQDGAQ